MLVKGATGNKPLLELMMAWSSEPSTNHWSLYRITWYICLHGICPFLAGVKDISTLRSNGDVQALAKD